MMCLGIRKDVSTASVPDVSLRVQQKMSYESQPPGPGHDTLSHNTNSRQLVPDMA